MNGRKESYIGFKQGGLISMGPTMIGHTYYRYT